MVAFTLKVKTHSAGIKAATAAPGMHLGLVFGRVDNLLFIGFVMDIWLLWGSCGGLVGVLWFA